MIGVAAAVGGCTELANDDGEEIIQMCVTRDEKPRYKVGKVSGLFKRARVNGAS